MYSGLALSLHHGVCAVCAVVCVCVISPKGMILLLLDTIMFLFFKTSVLISSLPSMEMLSSSSREWFLRSLVPFSHAMFFLF